MTTIRSVRARAVEIPVARPTRISTRVLGSRHFLLVEVEDSDGGLGFGYSYAGTSGGRILRSIVDEMLRPVVLGTDSSDIYGNYERCYAETLLAGRAGLVQRALSALDMSLWDLAAKRAGCALATLLGGSPREVPAYASGGYYRAGELSPEDAVKQEIEENEAAGFGDHKIKVGGLTPEQDAGRVRAAISALRMGGHLAVDANNAYRDAAEALRAIRILEEAAGEAGLWWVEEPLSPDDVPGHAALAAALETPIATGEIHANRHEFRALIEAGAADILQPDVGVVGGVSEWIRIARTAETFNLPVAPHWHANAHVQLAAATPNCLAIEHFDLAKDIYNFEQLVLPEHRLEARDGNVICPDRPGLGFDLDQDAISRFEIPG
jgi:L-alanine-DL-glutamate epimerase-like enolase superfamily enzyme